MPKSGTFKYRFYKFFLNYIPTGNAINTIWLYIQIYGSTTNHCAATLAPALAVSRVLDAHSDASEAGGMTSKVAEPLMGIVGSGLRWRGEGVVAGEEGRKVRRKDPVWEGQGKAEGVGGSVALGER